MKNSSRIGIFILLLLLAIGFASVTTNLILNNNVNVSAKPDDFNVIFYSANTEEGSSAIISDDKQVITYNTKQLVNPGDKSILDYEIKNNSSQYDADIDMSINIPDLIKDNIRVTYEGFNDIDTVNIIAKEIKAGKITIELIKPVIEDTQISIVVEFNANAVERNSMAYDTYTVRFNPNGGTGEVKEQEIYYNTLTPLISSNYTKAGYQLIGWSINTDASTLDYLDREEVINVTPSLTTKDLYAVWMKTDYTYTGNYQTFVVPTTGVYKIELWGAQGGTASGYSIGLGGYTKGNITLTKNNQYYIYIGGAGQGIGNGTGGAGWNGGGPGINAHDSNNRASGGGGATDIRLVNGTWNNTSGLRSRIMVAAGAGGASNYSNGGAAGGLIGIRDVAKNGYSQYNGGGGTQTSGGTVTNGGYGATNGSFGTGSVGSSIGGGGGGGYYGGAGGVRSGPQDGSGGGGSSFISGHLGCDAINASGTHTGQPNHYSGLVFTNTIMIDGQGYNWTNAKGSYVGQIQPDGTTATGHTGNGYARITFIGTN